MLYKLISADGVQSFELIEGVPMLLGRASGSDIPVFDPTISRRHAELRLAGGSLSVRDLGSSNGTFVDGARVTAAEVAPGQGVTFGQVSFRLEQVTAPATTATTERIDQPVRDHALAQTIVRPMRPGDAQIGDALSGSGFGERRLSMTERRRASGERRLSLLLEVSTGLARAVAVDQLLDTIVRFVFQILDADRAAIMLVDESGGLVPTISRDRRGSTAERAVPQSIARKVLEEKVAILTDNAGTDERFTGQSVVQQSVRSAICTPLVGSESRVHGVLYVDNLTDTNRFTEQDMDFLLAFSNIAAVAIENSRLAERLHHQALVRSNIERYLAPSLAARIAELPDAVRLGGEKRQVVVLFSDVRGFTTLAEQMRPDDVAILLSEYFTAMVECVFRHDGTLDKFIGDAVMAQWGAPIDHPDDADRAVRAAMDMMRELASLNERWRSQGRPELQIGVGLNRGEVFAGNIGSERRLEFTVIGDAVNVASGLCDAAAAGEILISEALAEALTEPPSLEARGVVDLKGKRHALRVFRVLP